MLAISGCENKPAQKALGAGVTQVGVVVARNPHPYAKIIGVALISAGTGLVVEAELADGSKQRFQIQLTDEQKKILEFGGEIEVVDPK